jgi:hypothetical protein
MDALAAAFPSMVEALLRNPEFMLKVSHSGWEETVNPFYTWNAIKICGDHGLPLPPWVCAYLFKVAENMASEEARRATDLRDVLKSILGFPGKGRGPGRLLDPDPRADSLIFAAAFAAEIWSGREPLDAFAAACDKVDPAVADRDDKTLWGWLADEFALTARPKTNLEWRTAVDAKFVPFITGVVALCEEMVSRNRAVT